MTYRAVDCQGFAGGFTLGMVQAGFELVAKREMKGGFGVANCEANRHLLGDTWKAEARAPETWTPVRADVVFGNPPCSGFSVMSHKDFRGAHSPINSCMWSFAEYAAKCRPQIAVFESVQMARTRPDGLELMRLLRQKMEEDTGDQWTLHHIRHNAIAVGGAAMRRRYFWLVSRVPFGIERHKQDPVPRLNDIFSDLDNLHPEWSAQPYRQPPTWWSKDKRSDTGLVDGHIGLVNPLQRRIMDLMKGTEWGPGDHIAVVARRHYETHGCLPPSFASTEAKLVSRDFNMGFTTPVRWRGDSYARVITGGALTTVLHPYLDRLITYREAVRIMGFPDDWLIKPLRHTSGHMLTYGKGITVQCGRWIGEWITKALDGTPGSDPGKEIGEREFDIDATHDYVPLT
jgi:site-specific DNA-cytosine methylase